MTLGLEPIDDARFSSLIGLCLDEANRKGAVPSPPPHIALGLSGGPDSMALCLLAADWAKKNHVKLTALTVDHGLRAESRAEATKVNSWLKRAGIDHEILVWEGQKPSSNIQAVARSARYQLMDDWCEAHGALHLLLAHHLEDQAETVLLRLGRGSGVHGLAGMNRTVRPPFPGGPWRIRPLLSVSKSVLGALLLARGQDWIEDPSNQNTRYRRVRTRQLWRGLADIGITPERLATTAENMARAREALDMASDALLVSSCQFYDSGYCVVDKTALMAAPYETGLRSLSRLLTVIGGRQYGPRLTGLERLWQNLKSDGDLKGMTLSACRIEPRSDGVEVMICRESRGIEASVTVSPGHPVTWDNRYRVNLINAPDNQLVTVGRMGRRGWSELRAVTHKSFGSQVPYPVRMNMPVVRRGGVLATVPYLDCAADNLDGSPVWAIDVQNLGLWRLGIRADQDVETSRSILQ